MPKPEPFPTELLGFIYREHLTPSAELLFMALQGGEMIDSGGASYAVHPIEESHRPAVKALMEALVAFEEYAVREQLVSPRQK